MEEYITILKAESAEVVEKKSKFIADIFYIESVEEAENIIKNIKKKYYDSRHNCIAYRVIDKKTLVERCSDDGEPSGTAGGPMLNILQKSNLCNVLVVVTRYFGGILLGTGGLVRAYSEATQRAIEKCNLITKIKGISAQVKLDYSNLEIFKYYCKNNNIRIVKIDYMEDIYLEIEMKISTKNKIMKEIETKSLNILDYKEVGEKYIMETVEKNK